MLTFLGNKINETTVAILYLCEYNYEDKTIKVGGEIQYSDGFDALMAYANIPNPESQMASGKTREDFERDLWKLHAKLNHPDWVRDLSNYL